MATDNRKKTDPEKIGNLMLHQIIGKKPRIPQTYAMRKVRNTDEDKEFCENVERRLAEWEDKAKKHREKKSQENAENRKLADEFIVKKVPPINLTPLQIYEDFKVA